VVDNPVQVGLASEDGYPHAGTVASVDNQVDPGTGTIRARARVANPDRVLMPGLFARVRLAGAGTAQALLVDDKAVLTDQDRKYLYVLGEGNTAQRRDVALGPLVNGLRVVESGLKPGDKVIVNGLQKVFMPGMPVAPKVVAMREATGAQAVAVVAQR
jgi:multidrug efflux system membrane fusion protein